MNFNLSIEERLLYAKIVKIIALIVAFLYYNRKSNKTASFLLMIAFSFVGGELISFIEMLLQNNGKIDTLSNMFNSGIRSSGAFLFGFIFIITFVNKDSTAYYLFMASLIGMLIIGKWHCFIIGDTCFGLQTDLPFGIIVNGLNPTNIKVHPAPLYDSVVSFFIFILLSILKYKKKLSNYYLFILGVTLISTQGLIMEVIRQNIRIYSVFTFNQIVYIILLFLILIVSLKKHLTKTINKTGFLV